MSVRITTTPEETTTLGREFAAGLRRGDVVALFGELGSGKTQFVKGVCDAFAVRIPVTSPTFVLLNRYDGRDAGGDELLVYHLDLYRIRSAGEIYDLGYEEILNGNGLCLIEWAETLGELLPGRRFDVRLSHGDRETERQIVIERVPAEAA
jgi:tRNA threonylcarbamoyladenosine biosynthesis protein TsaE